MTSCFQKYMGLGVCRARIITDRSVENQCIYTYVGFRGFSYQGRQHALEPPP